MFIAAFMLAGCCVGGYPPVWSANAPPPFDAFHAGMKLAVGMPTDVAILIIGSAGLRRGEKLRDPRRIRMAVPSLEIRLLRGQPASCLCCADA